MSNDVVPPFSPANGLAGKRVVGFGHSHLTPLQFAFAEDRLGERQDLPAIEFLQMLQPGFKTPTGAIDYPAIRARLLEEQGRGNLGAMFTCFSGNDYHVLSMVRHPQPFDFALPGRPDLGLQPGVQIVPFQAAFATMRDAIASAVAELRTLCGAVSCPLVFVASPPPIPSSEYLHQAHNAFWAKAEQLGVSPPGFRFKFWHMQSQLYETACTELGVRYLHPPPATQDSQGFMVERGWHPDGVHGNTWYGRQVLAQLFGLDP